MRSILLVVAFLVATIASPIQAESLPKEDEGNVRASALDKDFEDGRISPWYDFSPSVMHWQVEDLESPLDPANPAPAPVNGGTKYVRAVQSGATTSKQIVLKSPEFLALPGDEVSFFFWIRSERRGGNTLELVMSANLNETSLADVSDYSNPANMEWNQKIVTIPVTQPTNVVLSFFGNCGPYVQDAIAIDDILVGAISSGGSTTTLTPITSTGPISTTVIATTPSNNCGTDGDFPKPSPYCGPEYFQCMDGVGSLVACPDGAYFDSATAGCVPPKDSQCFKDFQCPAEIPNGFVPLYPDACTPFYFTCVNGQDFSQTCPDGYLYNPAACTCETTDQCAPSEYCPLPTRPPGREV